MAENDQAPKIQIDSDWKAQARAEKEKLAQQAKSDDKPAGRRAAGGAAGGRELPPANFETLISTLATQAMLFLGLIPDPRSGQRVQSLDLARHHIDLLALIEEKTKGNLTEEESNTLAATLYELRQRYIQMANASRGV